MNFSKFQTFLETIGCLDEFLQSLYFNNNMNLKDYFKSTDNEYLIADAFRWSSTELGTEFWSNIDDQYRLILK